MSKNRLNCGSEHLDETNVCECGYRFASAGPEAALQAPQANLTIPGWLMSVAGIALGVYAFAFFDPTVDGFVSSDYSSYGSRVNNTGLLQDQLMLFMAGCSMLIGGIVMLSTGALLNVRRT